MNIKRGMSRLAIVLGICGALLGLLLVVIAFGDYFASCVEGVIELFVNRNRKIVNKDPNLPSTFVGWLMLFSLPLAGFLIPWSLIRLVGWILSGFSSDPGESETPRPQRTALFKTPVELIDMFVFSAEESQRLIPRIYWALFGVYGWFVVICLLPIVWYLFLLFGRTDPNQLAIPVVVAIGVLLTWGLLLNANLGENKLVSFLRECVSATTWAAIMIMTLVYIILSFHHCGDATADPTVPEKDTRR